jgi:hypothetical protein
VHSLIKARRLCVNADRLLHSRAPTCGTANALKWPPLLSGSNRCFRSGCTTPKICKFGDMSLGYHEKQKFEGKFIF